MPTLRERWKAFRNAMARDAAKRSWSDVLKRSQAALDAATEPTRAFVRAEQARFEAARRRRLARESAGEPATVDGSADDDPR
ncbi:MAG: hypothetical protein AAF602_17910 [Myxococcota bacterium]